MLLNYHPRSRLHTDARRLGAPSPECARSGPPPYTSGACVEQSSRWYTLRTADAMVFRRCHHALPRSAQHALLPSPRATSGARSVRCCCRRVIRCPCHVPRPICRQAQVGSERVAGSRAGRARHASIGTSVLALPSIHPVMFRSLQVELARRPVSGTRDSSILYRTPIGLMMIL